MSTGFIPVKTPASIRVTPVHLGAKPIWPEYRERFRIGMAPELVGVQGASNDSGWFAGVYRLDGQSPVPELGASAGLEGMLALEDDWDGHGAVAPNADAVNTASYAVVMASGLGLDPILVAPDVDGGVAVYFAAGQILAAGGYEREAGLVVTNHHELVIFRRDRTTEAPPRFEEIASDALSAALTDVRVFLEG